MKEYKLTDTITINNKESVVKKLTLEDLYQAYELNKTISLVKIVNGDLKLLIDKED